MDRITFNGLSITIFDDVYSPAEDTWLLMKSIGKDDYVGKSVLDMGCGTGIIGLSLAAEAEHVDLADVSPSAVKNTALNIETNGIRNARVIESDLFNRIKGRYDLILFNPPYLPTDAETSVPGVINMAFDGGRDGADTIVRFLKRLSNHLKPSGKAYLVLSSLTNIRRIDKTLAETGFVKETVNTEDFFFERLICYRVERCR